MPLWQVIVLGIVQGLTEFLPISSTAHLIVVQRLFGRTDAQLKDDPYTVGIQLGTLVAVLVYFRHDLQRLAKAVWKDVLKNNVFASASNDGRIAKLILLGSIPVGVCGLLLKKTLEKNFYHPMAIGIIATVFALVMLASEWWAKRRQALGIAGRGDESITLFDALFVGAFQCLALMPGASRSGTTISAGLFAGLDRAAAARFSFLLSIPAILAAGAKDLFDKRKDLANGDTLLSLGVGLAVSAAVGYVCIAWLLKFLKSSSTLGFVVYRLMFGALLIAAVLAGWFTAGR